MVKATFYDYFVLQGGKPQITRLSNGLYSIKHGYRKDEPEIITHISPAKRDAVVLSDGKEYEVAFLWDFEGAPCEGQSIKNGGGGYERK